MCIVATRSVGWALACVRYQRHTPMGKPDSDNVYTACWNAWDLLLNVRGIGWNWSQGLVLPKPAFKTNSRVIFMLSTAVAFIFHTVALDACVQAIRVLSPEIVDWPGGGTLFDHTLPPFLELLRAGLVSYINLLWITAYIPPSRDRVRHLVSTTPISLAPPFSTSRCCRHLSTNSGAVDGIR